METKGGQKQKSNGTPALSSKNATSGPDPFKAMMEQAYASKKSDTTQKQEPAQKDKQTKKNGKSPDKQQNEQKGRRNNQRKNTGKEGAEKVS